MPIRLLDLFSGIGGFSKGILDTGVKFSWHGYSEIDKYAKSVYRFHFPEAEDLGDVRTIQPEGLPELDIITFGFPCQDISIAGHRGGWELNEVGCSLKQCELSGLQDPVILSLKTSRVFFQATRGETGLPSWEKLPSLGMMVNGNYLIQGGFCPRIESGSILSDILEESVDQKYFLSEKAIETLKKAEKDSGTGYGFNQSIAIITKEQMGKEP